MKIEKINENKIKITLTKKDLENRNIDIGKFKLNTSSYQQLLWDIMEHAEIEFGFDISESQLFIEAIADNSGDFIIIITRSSGEDLPSEIQHILMDKIISAGIFPLPLKNSSEIPISEKYDVVSFNDLDDIISLCQHLPQCKSIPSQLYNYKGLYYIVLKNNGRNINLLNIFESKSVEFNGTFIDTKLLPLLEEHGNKIISSAAIKKLSLSGYGSANKNN
jgi:adapter protein MecA 1/2